MVLSSIMIALVSLSVNRDSCCDASGSVILQDTVSRNIPARYENSKNADFYWIEAEDFVSKEVCFGLWKYRNAWTRKKNGLPNDSMDHSLLSPSDKRIASLSGSISGIKKGRYNLWLRMGSFAPWPKQGLTLKVNGKDYKLVSDGKSQFIEKAFSWIKINSDPVEIAGNIDLTMTNDIFNGNITTLDCFLLTSDLAFCPPQGLPRWEYFSVLPYSGPVAEADIWHPSKLDIPVYICEGSSQHFLLRIRNYADSPLKGFIVSVRVPSGISLLDPSRKKRWDGDDCKFKKPPFISASPTSMTFNKVTVNGKDMNEYLLHYDNEFPPYDIYGKVESLAFVTFKSESGTKLAEDSSVLLKVFDSDGKWEGAESIQKLTLLPKLSGPAPSDYRWGVDAIYFSFLSEEEQLCLLKSFGDAAVNTWASRVRENSAQLSSRNRMSWKLVQKNKRMNIVNWGEWFWPGSPYTDESLRYIEKHPYALGVYVNDDRGKSLAGKLICPTYLIKDPAESYIGDHMKRITDIMRENKITEHIEDAEYSSPLSFCFCQRCRKEFSVFCNIPYEKVDALSPDDIIKKYRMQWINFRCMQNAEILEKISRISHEMYPDIDFKVFCGYQSFAVKQRYGIEWESILKLHSVDGVYVGGGMPGTASQVSGMLEQARNNKKKFISMANATLSFPHGYDELSFRNPAYLEARIIHDIMCGSGGIFIWWWGTLDGRCLKAFETGARLSLKYGDILKNGIHSYSKVGITDDFVMLKSVTPEGTLLSLANPSRFSEDKVDNPDLIMLEFPKETQVLNVLTGKKESYEQIRKNVESIYEQGQVALWFIPAN